MGARGRKTEADLSVITDMRPVAPPTGLSDRARQLFGEIAASTGPKHFVASDVPLLVTFVEAVSLKEEAQRNIDKQGAVYEGKTNPWYTILNNQAKLISNMAIRLRLTPHSRFDARQTERNSRKGHSVYDSFPLDE